MSAHDDIPRRTVLLSAAAAGGGALLLAGCGSDDSSTTPAASASTASATPPATAGATPAPGATTAKALAPLADIPVGGSISVSSGGKPVILAQPAAGKVVCFSAICTHQGCTVGSGGPQLHCPCHGSLYDAATGAVVKGPAPRPLTAIPVAVSGPDVVLS